MPNNMPNKEAMEILNKVFQSEMAGVVRYLHYSFMVMGHNRIPIQKWFRDQANESSQHAIMIGEKITSYGGHPSLMAAQVEESKSHSVHDLLEESLKFEDANLNLYKQLVKVSGDDIALEELARTLVRAETEHCDEVKKMLRTS